MEEEREMERRGMLKIHRDGGGEWNIEFETFTELHPLQKSMEKCHNIYPTWLNFKNTCLRCCTVVPPYLLTEVINDKKKKTYIINHVKYTQCITKLLLLQVISSLLNHCGPLLVS